MKLFTKPSLKKAPPPPRFKDLKALDVFALADEDEDTDESFLLRIIQITPEGYNSINLITGTQHKIAMDEEIILYPNATLALHGMP